jgi:hypothetical protein
VNDSWLSSSTLDFCLAFRGELTNIVGRITALTVPQFKVRSEVGMNFSNLVDASTCFEFAHGATPSCGEFKPDQLVRQLLGIKPSSGVRLKSKQRARPRVTMRNPTFPAWTMAEPEILLTQCGFRSMWAADSIGNGPYFRLQRNGGIRAPSRPEAVMSSSVGAGGVGNPGGCFLDLKEHVLPEKRFPIEKPRKILRLPSPFVFASGATFGTVGR